MLNELHFASYLSNCYHTFLILLKLNLLDFIFVSGATDKLVLLGMYFTKLT